MTFAHTPIYDKKVQQFHGGQDWKHLDNFIEDFSVTTNALGTPSKSLEYAKTAIDECCHYPPINQEPAKSKLSHFLFGENYSDHSNRLLLGNGASEVIDLVIRHASKTATKFKSGPFCAQYKEYERAAKSNGFSVIDALSPDKVDLACLVNPCNPTGDYLNVQQQLEWIEKNVIDGGFVLLDESMQIWHSSQFREFSLLSKQTMLLDLFVKRNIQVFIIHSWTKIWSCTGLRLGSIVCPTEAAATELKLIQIPWSVNVIALKFLEHVVEDEEYLEKTWQVTPVWRKYSTDKLKEFYPQWKCYGEDFLSWIWVDTKNEKIADSAVELAKEAGVPIRSGRPGYNLPTFIRIAVREPEKFDILLNSFSKIDQK
ncbi:hypothetical protein BB561_006640 [Smittium simulii]|uniref:Aminotransferase class I/classII large domain-containing protein n=1 Tax=Smittium simulii TaxID=133385 RepID=A0A2T9Y2Q6_9FUNG|nr:hypothetical protein BB561_006640 [Smittium simulii]